MKIFLNQINCILGSEDILTNRLQIWVFGRVNVLQMVQKLLNLLYSLRSRGFESLN